jgi:alcohol dehydrogenase class IV
VLLVSDRGLRNSGLLDRPIELLGEAGLELTIYTDMGIDPDVEVVARGAALARRHECDVVVGIGGGSPMCAAKAVAVVATNGGTIRDYEGFGNVGVCPLPTICVPTTAGSGTEVSAVTIITDRERHVKMPIGSPLMYPPLAILDAELLLSLPFQQAAASGLDALSHAVEACLTTQATPLTNALALGAVELLGRHLVKAAETRSLEAKESCLLASSMANLACGNARLGLNHALTWPISSLFELPHGLANAVMLPYVLEFTLPKAFEPMSRIAIALGEAPGTAPPEELAGRTVDRVRGLLDDLRFPTCFTEDQIDPSRIPEMVEMILRPGIYSLFRQVNLRVADREDLTMLYRSSLEGWQVD